MDEKSVPLEPSPADPDHAIFGPDQSDGGPLAEIDEIERAWRAKQDAEAEAARQLAADRKAFADEFTRVCTERLRPAMEAVIGRLRADGGDGVIAERPEDLSRLYTHRLTLWMSLTGKIEGAPRPDRHPYLQFDAHPDTRIVTISEGDIWQGKGGNHSGVVDNRPLSDIGPELIAREVVAILRRAIG